MPAKSGTTATNTNGTGGVKTTPVPAKKFNPKIGSGFSNDAFGEGSVLINIDADGLDSIMKNLQVGSTILLKYNKVTVKGNKHYFAEILPPMDKRKSPARSAGTSELD